MRRSKFLALALIVSLMVMGVGYAKWSDTLVAVGTVKTGTLDVGFVKQNYHDNDGIIDVKVNTYVQDDKATVTVENMYPGSEAEFQLELKNYGSLPAKTTISLDNFEISNEDFNFALANLLGSEIKVEGKEINYSELIFSSGLDLVIPSGKTVTIEGTIKLSEDCPPEMQNKTASLTLITDWEVAEVE